MGAIGIGKLLELLDEPDLLPPRLPSGVRSDALAKACWLSWSDYLGGPWRDSDFDLIDAKIKLSAWVRDTFAGGAVWAYDANFYEWSEGSAAHALHLELDRKEKFALASRYLHAFVVTGEPKLSYRARAKEAYTQIEMASPELD